MVAHYGSYYAADFYDVWMREYASEFVAIFFVLAGLGSFYSFRNLLRRHQSRRLSLRMVGGYYMKRALRIYPMYWLALATIPFILPEYGRLHEPTIHTLAVYMAYPGVAAPGIYWFIPALVQCYLLAPLLYLFFSRLSMRVYLAFIAFTTTVFMVVTRYYSELLALTDGFGVPDPEALFYRPMFMANIVLFALGIAIPGLLAGWPAWLRGGWAVLAAALVMLLMMYLVRDNDTLFRLSHLILFPGYMLSIMFFCLVSLASGLRLPLYRVLTPMGESSYPPYLFHRHYFGLLAMAGIVVGDSLISVAFTLLLFPLFLLFCRWLEGAGRRFTDAAFNRLAGSPAVALPETEN